MATLETLTLCAYRTPAGKQATRSVSPWEKFRAAEAAARNFSLRVSVRVASRREAGRSPVNPYSQ